MAQRRKDISVIDVARKARVSVGTVSRVMNQATNVSPDLRRRVLATGRKLGFSPKRQHPAVAVITGRHSSGLPIGYVSIMTALISRYAAARQWSVELVDIDNLDAVLECHVDAAIGLVFDDRIAALRQVPNLSAITINHPLASRGIHSIYTDHAEQGRLAAEYLIQRGHRDIAFLAIQNDEWGAQQRAEGYRGALRAAGVEPRADREGYTLTQPVEATLRRWVAGGVTALLNFSEDQAMNVLALLGNVLGLRIGQDIATITLEDLPIYQYFTPPQTVIRQPLEQLAQEAVDRAIAFTESARRGQPAVTITDLCLRGRLIERQSVMAGPHPSLEPAAPAAENSPSQTQSIHKEKRE